MLRLSKNNVEKLPEWIGEFASLRPRNAADHRDILWWADRFDLGQLRLDCLLAKADGLIEQGETGEATALLDGATAEVERHLADHNLWGPSSLARIARRRARITS